MDWNSSMKSFVSRPETSHSFLYNSNYEQYSGLEGKDQAMSGTEQYGNMEKKKKRLTNEQIESLERNFLEDIKLEPERKIKLSQELDIHPRQIAVWFQNRRARWKAKQIERLYDSLKQDYDLIYSEKQRLQEEVFRLKAILREQVWSEMPTKETVESASGAINRSSNNQLGASNNALIVEEYNPVLPSFWAPCALPNYP